VFFFNSIFPGGVAPSAEMEKLVNVNFGGFLSFKDRLRHYAHTVGGQGWVWLVEKDGQISMHVTKQFQHPLLENGVTPLLVLDMWEHSYYLDYLNKIDVGNSREGMREREREREGRQAGAGDHVCFSAVMMFLSILSLCSQKVYVNNFVRAINWKFVEDNLRAGAPSDKAQQ
jgi:superoxide dismutase